MPANCINKTLIDEEQLAGVRVISSTQHELLRQVPTSLVDVFKIGSTTPGRQTVPI